MTHTFHLKQLEVPLFGVLDVRDQTKWLTAFRGMSAQSLLPLTIDEAAYEVIADELELDSDGLIADTARYAAGLYRTKTRGIGGSQLGNLGEVLVFLLNRASRKEIVRVMSWKPAQTQLIKDARFPQPDFIVRDSAGVQAALEVKSTEAFNYIELLKKNKWTWLQPCSKVAERRNEALPQLGFVNNVFTKPNHSLVGSGGKIVPFPVGAGIAAAVLTVDGRINTIRSHPTFRTPRECRPVHDCWTCVPQGCNFVVVTMPNEPGKLSLAGYEANGNKDWLTCYRRWATALIAHDLPAIKKSLEELCYSIEEWLSTDKMQQDKEILLAFWGSYLHDCISTRGVDVQLPEKLRKRNLANLGFDWIPGILSEPICRRTTLDDLSRVLQNASEHSESFALSVDLAEQEDIPRSLAVEVANGFLTLRLASNVWWGSLSVEDASHASKIAAELIQIVLKLFNSGISSPESFPPIPLKAINAQVGEDSILLGWQAMEKDSTFDYDSRILWYKLMKKYWFIYPRERYLFRLGIPKFRLRVFPDGRADFRISWPQMLL